jgi:hypothetical protein
VLDGIGKLHRTLRDAVSMQFAHHIEAVRGEPRKTVRVAASPELVARLQQLLDEG